MALVEEALKRLGAFVEVEGMVPSTRFPPERELAIRLVVSRTTLRGALARLESQGRIWRHVGKGTFLGRRSDIDAARVVLPPELLNPDQVMEVRIILEPAIAAVTALRATAADIVLLDRCVEKIRHASNIEAYEVGDRSFHQIVADATRNPLLIILFRAVEASRGQQVWGQLNRGTLTPQRHRRYVRQLVALVNAIRSRHPERAERIMRQHLEAVREDLFGRWV